MKDLCNCTVCTMVRRRREIDQSPTVEAYRKFCEDLMSIWLNEDMDSDLKIIHLEEKLAVALNDSSQAKRMEGYLQAIGEILGPLEWSTYDSLVGLSIKRMNQLKVAGIPGASA